jgi:hypothetical protein
VSLAAGITHASSAALGPAALDTAVPDPAVPDTATLSGSMQDFRHPPAFTCCMGNEGVARLASPRLP